MRVVYSRPFIRERGLNGAGDTILVPDGYVYIVRQLSAFCDPGTEGDHVFFEHTGTGQTLWYQQFQPEARDSRQLDCRFVFWPTEGFRFRSDSGVGGGVDVYAGGYQLTLP